MAGKYGGQSLAFFLVDGYNFVSVKLQSLRYKIESLLEDSHGLGDSWREVVPVGVSRAELAQEGAFFDTTTGLQHDILRNPGALTPQTAARVVTFGLAGNTAGQPFIGFQGTVVPSYEVLAEREKLQRANVSYTVTGKAEHGVILHALGAETAAGNTEGALSVDHATESATRAIPITSSSVANPTVITTTNEHGLVTGDKVLISGHSGSTPTINVENTVTVLTTTTFTVPINVTVGGTGGIATITGTSSGGAGYIEMTALTLGGYTNAVVKVRHSLDDVTYADLLSFTSRTAIGAERVTVAGTVYRHLAQSLALTGSGSGFSTTYFVGFARG